MQDSGQFDTSNSSASRVNESYERRLQALETDLIELQATFDSAIFIDAFNARITSGSPDFMFEEVICKKSLWRTKQNGRSGKLIVLAKTTQQLPVGSIVVVLSISFGTEVQYILTHLRRT